MSECTWIDAPPPVDLGDHAGGSHHCIGPPSSRETDLPGYGEAVPQAFLAEFRPGFTLDVHFHRVDQFQWFVRGGARFASHAVAPNTLHFADRYTPYGPLVTADDRVSFLTLRTTSDTGAHFMPAARASLRDELSGRAEARPRRNLTWDLAAVEPVLATWVDLCAESDGLRVALVDIEEGEPLPRLRSGDAGAFVGVVSGTIRSDDRLVTAGGFLALPARTVLPDVVGGVGGSRVGLFQFPRRAPVTSKEE